MQRVGRTFGRIAQRFADTLLLAFLRVGNIQLPQAAVLCVFVGFIFTGKLLWVCLQQTN